MVRKWPIEGEDRSGPGGKGRHHERENPALSGRIKVKKKKEELII